MTTLRSIVRFAVASSAILVGASACGGSTSRRPPPTEVLGHRFAANVVAECERALGQKKAEPPFPFPSFDPTKPDVSRLPAIGRYEERGVRIFRDWEARLLALGAPPSGRKLWSALLEPLHAHVRIIADQEAAALRSDAARFTADYFAGNQAQKELTLAADDAGVPICANAAGA